MASCQRSGFQQAKQHPGPVVLTEIAGSFRNIPLFSAWQPKIAWFRLKSPDLWDIFPHVQLVNQRSLGFGSNCRIFWTCSACQPEIAWFQRKSPDLSGHIGEDRLVSAEIAGSFGHIPQCFSLATKYRLVSAEMAGSFGTLPVLPLAVEIAWFQLNSPDL